MRVTIRILREVYEEAREQAGRIPPEEAFDKGVRSYLSYPKILQLGLDGTDEERLEELLTMLAQTRAAYGLLRSWEGTEGKRYRANREEYTSLADEYERLQHEVIANLEHEIRELAVEVTVLEARLAEQGTDPGEIPPPFPTGVSRPALAPSPEKSTEQGWLKGLWRRATGSEPG